MKTIISFLSMFLPLCLVAQIKGTVSNQSGEALPFVNIHLEGTTTGTSTNIDGEYELNVKQGDHTLIFQYVGYQTQKHNITYDGTEKRADFSLQEENYRIEEIVIAANAEDPAYAIIRKAQAKRKDYLKYLSNRKCDAYVRGINKIISAPEKIMGMEIGDLDGMIDSTRQGVVYLSESVSKLYFLGEKSKEEMYSSKVSGDDQGYSFNSAQEMEFNFYNNSLNVNREIISPIARNALNYYNYKLIGAKPDKNNILVNKIQVIPKNNYSNTFSGFIYINEDLWNIHSLELYADKHSTNLPFIDTLSFRQIFAPYDDKSWVPLSNVINFKMGAFGFKVAGNFACVYSNYELNTVTKEDLNHEIYTVLENSNARSDTYWDTIRPIPLSLEEKIDYHKKDSIRIIRSSPEYLDSIDQAKNKFKLSNILFGYSHQNSFKHRNWSWNSPFSSIKLNTIQGWHTNLGLKYRNQFTKQNLSNLNASLNLNYGLSEKKIRPTLKINYLANKINYPELSIGVGQDVIQFSRINPISTGLNSLFTYFGRTNYLKAYDRKYILADYKQHITRGVYGGISINVEERSALINNYNGGLGKDKREFSSNDPTNPQNFGEAFELHQAVILRLFFNFRIGEKTISYPDKKFRQASGWPSFSIYYKGGLPVLGTEANFNLIYAVARKRMNLGNYGSSLLRIKGGLFIGETPEYFMDYIHFQGNQTHIGYPSEYSYRFLNLPYYQTSTNESFFELHYQHDFNGYILSKLPLFKLTGFELVTGYKMLHTPDATYDEIHLGLDNLGYKNFRLLRLDYVWSKLYDEGLERSGAIVLGLKIEI